jgi:hypothetical protein
MQVPLVPNEPPSCASRQKHCFRSGLMPWDGVGSLGATTGGRLLGPIPGGGTYAGRLS